MKYIEFPKVQDRKKNALDHIVFSTRLRIARNLEGPNFPLILSDEEKRQIDQLFVKLLQPKPYDLCVHRIEEMLQYHILGYLANHVLTHEFLKNGHTFLYETNGDWVILLNEDDHIRIFSIEQGYNAKNMYQRLSAVMTDIEEDADFAYDENYGYLTSSVLNIGTGLRISAIVNLFGLAATKKMEQLIETANKMGYSIVNINGGGESGLFVIYNIVTLGLSEETMLSEFEFFLERVMELEDNARKDYFADPEEVELAYEELFDVSIQDKLSWSNLLYYISLIDAMNKKHLFLKEIDSLRNLLFFANEDYMIYNNLVEKEKVDSLRISLFKNYISRIRYKPAKV